MLYSIGTVGGALKLTKEMGVFLWCWGFGVVGFRRVCYRWIMKERCEWCHDKAGLKGIMVEGTNPFSSEKGELSFFVCGEHEEKLRGFYGRVRRYGVVYLGLICLFLLCLVGSSLLALWPGNFGEVLGYLFIGSFGALGLVMIIFPFCSPGTYEFMSVATSIILVRIMGGVIFAVGVVGVLLAFLYGGEVF